MGTARTTVPDLGGRTLTTAVDTGLPVITDADAFFAYCAHTPLSEEMRRELVETAASGPLRRYGQFDGAPVDDVTWYTAALSIPGLTVEELKLLIVGISEGPSRDLSQQTRSVLAHPNVTDEVVCTLIRVASYRKDRFGASEKVPSILAELDRAGHPAAVAWRLSMAGALIWEPVYSRPELTGLLRELGPMVTAAADRLGVTWSGTLEDLLDVARGVGADTSR